jgi:hypothetical protein
MEIAHITFDGIFPCFDGVVMVARAIKNPAKVYHDASDGGRSFAFTS